MVGSKGGAKLEMEILLGGVGGNLASSLCPGEGRQGDISL